VAEDLRDDPTVTVGDPEPLAFDADGEFSRTL
jgi:Txe/YoeB family toxin of Txe-Axe toxin-antitoxin module